MLPGCWGNTADSSKRDHRNDSGLEALLTSRGMQHGRLSPSARGDLVTARARGTKRCPAPSLQPHGCTGGLKLKLGKSHLEIRCNFLATSNEMLGQLTGSASGLRMESLNELGFLDAVLPSAFQAPRAGGQGGQHLHHEMWESGCGTLLPRSGCHQPFGADQKGAGVMFTPQPWQLGASLGARDGRTAQMLSPLAQGDTSSAAGLLPEAPSCSAWFSAASAAFPVPEEPEASALTSAAVAALARAGCHGKGGTKAREPPQPG